MFLGASDGGMVAQIYVQKFPGEAGGMVLISTGGMDANTLKSLRRKYFLAPLMLWYMKRCNYEKLKPKLIQAGMRHIRNESPEEIAYAGDSGTDIDFALAVGMLPVGTPWGYRSRQELADHGAVLLPGDPAELAALLLERARG